jgi:hypothetical protein
VLASAPRWEVLWSLYLCIGLFMDCALWNARAFLSFSMYRQMNTLWNFLQLGYVISISAYLFLSQHSPCYCRILFRITWLLGIVHHLLLKTECDILGTVAVPVLRLQACQALTWLWPTKSIYSVTVPFFWILGDGQVQEPSIPKCNVPFLEPFGI